MERNLTTGSIGGSLLAFSAPMILGNLIQQLYNIVDTLIVGQTIGATALVAVGSSYALMVLLNSVILGLCMGSGVVFAQLYGARQTENLRVSVYNAFLFTMLASVLLNALAFSLMDSLLIWLNIPPQALSMTREYLRIILAGMLLVSLTNFFGSALRSIGNTVMPLVFLAVSAIVNILLDLLFILHFHMGVAGAALATVIAQGLSALLTCLYFLLKAKGIRPGRGDMRLDKALLQKIISHSTLTAAQQSIMNFGILMVQGLVNSFGTAASAAFAVVVKIDTFAYMPAQDFGNAFATYVAQNFGAGSRDRIKRGFHTALKLSCCFCVAVSALVYLFAEELMLLFVKPGEVQTLLTGVQYLRIEGVFYAGIGVLFLLYALYRGLGKAGMSIVLTVISLGSRVALAYALAALPGVGLVGVWWAVPIGWALADGFGLIYFMHRRDRLLPPLSP